jgi:hypothetical protein
MEYHSLKTESDWNISKKKIQAELNLQSTGTTAGRGKPSIWFGLLIRDSNLGLSEYVSVASSK